MTAPASRFLTGGRTRLIGTSLGSPGAGELPNGGMFWPAGITPGWPSGDLANYNQWKAMCGRKPDEVRLYAGGSNASDPFSATGTTGSAGNYGFITPDFKSMANDGAILVITWQDGTASGWQNIADQLNAAGSNATKTKYLTFIQNLKRWHDDTGNTNPWKSIKLGTLHEPSNDGGTGLAYKNMTQAVINFFLDNGIGYGPKPGSGHGSSWVGTWYDMIEWIHVGIGFDMRHAIGEYAYYPGDGFVQWVYFDIYAWSGGYQDSGGTGFTTTKGGGIAQPGATGPVGHYADSLKTLRDVADNPLSWWRAGAGGSRPVHIGLGEFAISEDLDRFTAANPLGGGATHTGDKHIKGDWTEGVRKYMRAEAFTVPGGHDAGNNLPVDAEGLLFESLIHWNSQAAQPRWFNSRPFLHGDTTAATSTGGTTTGTDAAYSFDKFVTLVNDTIFTGSPVIHTPPIGDFVWANTEGGTANDVTFDATITAHDGAIVSYLWDPGDGSGTQLHTSAALTDELAYTYLTAGLFTATCLVTDANGLTLALSHQVVVLPANSPLSGAPYIAPLDRVKALRSTYNPAIDALENYTASRVHRIGMKSGTWTNMPAARTEFLGGTTARRYADLTGMTKIKAVCALSVAGATGAKLAPAYSIDGGTTFKWFDSATAAGTTVSTTMLGASTAADTIGLHTGTYGDIPPEARIAGVIITMEGITGDGAADPVYESIDLQVK